MPRSVAEQRILGIFFRDGRIALMPTKRAKRLVVLDEVAQRFELGTTYAEAEVDEILVGLYDDYAALRRYLVDEGFLTREAGVYWRTGGTVDLDRL